MQPTPLRVALTILVAAGAAIACTPVIVDNDDDTPFTYDMCVPICRDAVVARIKATTSCVVAPSVSNANDWCRLELDAYTDTEIAQDWTPGRCADKGREIADIACSVQDTAFDTGL